MYLTPTIMPLIKFIKQWEVILIYCIEDLITTAFKEKHNF